jgi:hypothetical protein
MEGSDLVNPMEKFTISPILLKNAEDVLIPGKNMDKPNMNFPGKLEMRLLLMNFSNMKRVVSEAYYCRIS